MTRQQGGRHHSFSSVSEFRDVDSILGHLTGPAYRKNCSALFGSEVFEECSAEDSKQSFGLSNLLWNLMLWFRRPKPLKENDGDGCQQIATNQVQYSKLKNAAPSGQQISYVGSKQRQQRHLTSSIYQQHIDSNVVAASQQNLQLKLLWRWILIALTVSTLSIVACIFVAFCIIANSTGRWIVPLDASKWLLNTVPTGSSLINYNSFPVTSEQDAVHGLSSDTSEKRDRTSAISSSHLHVSRLKPDGSLLTQEAVQAMQAANHLLMQGGRQDKAKRLLNHAVKLCPKSPDVWIQLGNYLEFYERNLVEAESMYKKAYICDPYNSHAVTLIKRTDPQVQEIYSEIYRRIDRKRDIIAQVPPSDPALRRAMRETYYLHIYHTNAIEGNSLSLLQTRSIIETGYVVPGKTIKEHTEVLGLHDALGYINATLVNKPGPVTIDDLLEIHKRVLSYADPHIAGIFRNHQVYIANHIPPSPDLIEQEMNNFFLWLKSESVSKLHPIELAGLAHYWLVHIHPFVDGNGRTARLLMNLILMQSGFPPVTISFSDRLSYYEFLQLGNEGDIRPFLRFVASCTERSLDAYLDVTGKQILPQESASDEIDGEQRKRRIESLFENAIPLSYEIDRAEVSKPSKDNLTDVSGFPSIDNGNDEIEDSPSIDNVHYGPQTEQSASQRSKSEPKCPFEEEFCK